MSIMFSRRTALRGLAMITAAAIVPKTASAACIGWCELPGAARDVGAGWVIGMTPAGGGYSIHRLNGESWERMPGAAVRIGGTLDIPWVVNDRGHIYRWNGTSWDRMPGAARDVGDGWVVGMTPAGGGYSIHRWNGSSWDRMPGAAIRIGGTRDVPWVVNDRGHIYRWNGSSWDKMPGSARDVGDGWVIGNTPSDGGYSIHRWNGSNWTRIGGGAVAIGGNSSYPFIVNNSNRIYYWSPVT